MDTNETKMLAEVNARIAADLAMEKDGLSAVLRAKLSRVANTRTRQAVALTKDEQAALAAREGATEGWFMIGSVQVCFGHGKVWRL